jgi:hypothetical protein
MRERLGWWAVGESGGLEVPSSNLGAPIGLPAECPGRLGKDWAVTPKLKERKPTCQELEASLDALRLKASELRQLLEEQPETEAYWIRELVRADELQDSPTRLNAERKLRLARKKAADAEVALRDTEAMVEIVGEKLAVDVRREQEAQVAAARERSDGFRQLEMTFLDEAGERFADLVGQIRAHMAAAREHESFWRASGLPGDPPHALETPIRNVEEALCGLYLSAFARDSGNDGVWLSRFVKNLGDDAPGGRRYRVDTDGARRANVGRLV